MTTVSYDCDRNLPKEGLELDVKLFLLGRFDSQKGGTKVSNYKSRFLHHLCNEFPAQLGCKGSHRRKRVKWLVDRWKRDKDFDATRMQLMLLSSSAISSLPLQPSLVPPPDIKRTTPVKTEEAPTPTIFTMSTVKREADIGSPLRMLRGTGKKKGRRRLSCLS